MTNRPIADPAGAPIEVDVHAIEPRSRANGPGTRFAIWFQGCTLACPGCFNPTTHPSARGQIYTVDALVERIQAQAGDGGAIEGVTLSGGEPLQQPEAALALVSALRERTSLSILVFSGYAIDEIRAQPWGEPLLARIDVLIDGRYQSGQRLGRGLRGSHNQRIWCLTPRYTEADIADTPDAEIRIDPRGQIVLSGVNPLKLK